VYEGLCFESSAGLYYVAITQWFIAVFAMVMFTFRSVFYPITGMTTIKAESNLDEEKSPRESNVTAIEEDTHIVADLARIDGALDDEIRLEEQVVTLSSLSTGLMKSAALSSSTDGTIPPSAAELNDTASESSPSLPARDTSNLDDSPPSENAPVNEEASLILPTRAHSTDTTDVVTASHQIPATRSFP
jgi:hypothetical protein